MKTYLPLIITSFFTLLLLWSPPRTGYPFNSNSTSEDTNCLIVLMENHTEYKDSITKEIVEELEYYIECEKKDSLPKSTK